MKSRLGLVRCFFVGFLLFTFTILLSKICAQNENAERLKDEADAKEFTAKIKKHLSDKYPKDSIGDVTSFVKKGLHGGKEKSLYIIGNIEREKSVTVLEGPHGQARAIVQEFINEEGAELFVITDSKDLREFKVLTESVNGHDITYIHLQRYIDNLRIDNMDIRISLKNNSILSVNATLAPISSEMIKTVKRKTISEEDVKKIIEDDLNKDALLPDTDKYALEMILNKEIYPRFTKIEKLAIPITPYVIWHVISIWDYSIDAFTGEIVKKQQSWIDN